jgi:hypothetical protein
VEGFPRDARAGGEFLLIFLILLPLQVGAFYLVIPDIGGA